MNASRATWLLSVFALAGACSDGGTASTTDAANDGGPDGGVGDAASGAETATDGPAPVRLGNGYNPGLALDPAGTGYIAWVGPENTVTTLNFCRLPRNAQACDAKSTIAAPGTSLSRPFVVVSGPSVQVLSYRYGLEGADFSGVFLFTSADGGQTFDQGRRVGTAPFVNAALGADGSVSLTTHAYHHGLVYQAVSLAAAAPAVTAEAVLSTTHPYVGTVGFDGMVPLVVYANGGGDAQFRRYLGMGERNEATSWSAPQDIGKADRMHLASGPKGLVMLSQGAVGLELRRFEGGTFTAGTPVPGGTGELAHAHLVQDAVGRLYVLWPRIEASGVYLHHAVSDDAGGTWRSRILTGDPGFNDVRAAVAPDQIGLVVWGSAGSAATSQISATPLARTP